jgi:hypothetical protein
MHDQVAEHMARAAIAAMREPTEAMLQSAHLKITPELVAGQGYWPGLRQRWRQMIDAALGEPAETEAPAESVG